MRDIKFGKPLFDDNEKKAVADVLSSDILVHGKNTKEFELKFSEFTKAPFSVSVASCTAALHLSYFIHGIGDGNEVIVPAESHVATAHAVEYVGAKPIFIDAEINTGNIDINQIESKINENTKAISIVHYLGMPVDMLKIMEIAKKYNLKVIEDCALGLGSFIDRKHVGLFGDTGCFSFYPVKHITTAEGGMLITKYNHVAELINSQKAFGYDKVVNERKIPGEYDVNNLGFNYRMNEIEAAIGIEQLKKISVIMEKREENYTLLEKGMKNINEITLFQSSYDKFKSSYYCLSVILKDSLSQQRLAIIDYLKQKGVGTSIYYPKPIPHFTYYKEKYGYDNNSFPVAAKISYNSIAFPVGPHLDGLDMEYIISTFKKAIMEVK